MTKSKLALSMCAVAAVVSLAGATTASAQDWRRGEYEYFKGPHRFGALCEYRIGAKGSAPMALFGGNREVRKAERRSIADWEFEARRLFGPAYASWDLAMDKRVRCETRGLEFVCSAGAHPCRPR